MKPPRAVVVAALVFAALYVALDLNKLYALRYGADTGTFLQFLNGEAHGLGSWNSAEGRPHLQVHDSWSLLLFVPLVRVFPYAQTLLVLQVVAVAAAAPALSAFALACGAERRAAAFVGIAYLVSPSAQSFAYGDVTESSFVPLLAVCAAVAVRRRAALAALVCASALLGLKEDQAPLLLWFGAACALWWDRRIGLAVATLAVLNGAAFALAERVGGAAPSLPAYSLRPTTPLDFARLFAALLAQFAFAPLWLRWRLLLGLPLVAELVFARPWAYPLARLGAHWSASLAAAVALSAAYVIARRPRFATPALIMGILCALTINDTVLKPGRWPFIVDWQAYGRAAALRSASTVARIPRNQEGVYAVAAANRNAVLLPYDAREPYCPAYNTNLRALVAALGAQGYRGALCGGVPTTGERPRPAPP